MSAATPVAVASAVDSRDLRPGTDVTYVSDTPFYTFFEKSKWSGSSEALKLLAQARGWSGLHFVSLSFRLDKIWFGTFIVYRELSWIWKDASSILRCRRLYFIKCCCFRWCREPVWLSQNYLARRRTTDHQLSIVVARMRQRAKRQLILRTIILRINSSPYVLSG